LATAKTSATRVLGPIGSPSDQRSAFFSKKTTYLPVTRGCGRTIGDKEEFPENFPLVESAIPFSLFLGYFAMRRFRTEPAGSTLAAFTNEFEKYSLNFTSDTSVAMVGSIIVPISTFIEAVREDSGAIVKGTNKKEIVPAKL